MRNVSAALLLLLFLTGCDYFVSAEAHVDRARSRVEQGEYRAAVIELKNALQKDPELQSARLMLAEVALWLGDATSAEAELKRVPAQVEPAKRADLAVRIELGLGQWQQVLESLQADGIEPARRSLYRGLVLQATNKPAEAEAEFRAAAQSDPQLVAARVGIAEVIAAQGRVAEAVQLTAATVADHPESALAWYAHGALLARNLDTKAALQALQRSRELAPRQLEVVKQAALLTALVDVQLATQDTAAARVSSDALSKLVPGSPIALLMSSRVAIAANEYAQAVSDLRRVVSSSPRFVQARFMLGVALLAQGNLEQAGQELNRVLQDAPEHTEARRLLAQVRMRLQDPDGALRVLVPALQTTTDDTRLTSLADAARSQADAPETVKLLEQALLEAPNSEALQLQLASAYLQAGLSDKALALLRGREGGSADARRMALLVQAIAKAEGPAAARAQVESFAAANPSDKYAISLAAAYYASVGDVSAARRLLGNALAAQRDDPSLLFTLAQIEWTARQPQAAANALERLLAANPGNVLAGQGLAELELSRGNAKAAAERLEAVRKADPQAAQARLLLARIALAQHDPKRAEALVDEALKGAPGRGDLRNAAGMLYLTTGHFDQAISHFRSGTAIDPASPILWLNLGRAQMALGQSEPARESFQRALAARPHWVAAEGSIAFLDLQNGDQAAALQRVATLKRALPGDAGVLTLEGEVQMALRHYAEAAQSWAAAYAKHPSAQLAEKIYQARSAGKLPDATQPLQRWLQQHPDDLFARSQLAEAYARAGERRLAVAEYEAVLEQRPQHVASLNNLAWLLHELGDARAVEFARKANALAPNAPAVSDTLGWLLVESGKVDEGLPILKGAASQAGAGAEIEYHYAVALARSGAREQARDLLQETLEHNPAFPSRHQASRLLTELSAGAGG